MPYKTYNILRVIRGYAYARVRARVSGYLYRWGQTLTRVPLISDSRRSRIGFSLFQERCPIPLRQVGQQGLEVICF